MLEGEKMKYLETTLHISVKYESWEKEKKLPPFLLSRYSLKIAYLGGIRTLFLYPIQELESMADIKSHLQIIYRYENIPVVVVPKKITLRQRNYMIKLGIPFVVEKKHIYLPFMAIVTQERCDKERIEVKKMTAIAQVLFLYLIYLNKKEVTMSEINEKLELNPMSISRAISQLNDLQLVGTHKEKNLKIIVLEQQGRELFEKGLLYLNNPVKETIYVNKCDMKETMLISGYTALSELTMLSSPQIMTYACKDIKNYKENSTESLIDKDEQVEIQKWIYNPRVLSNNQIVDVLSLYLSLYYDRDERVEGELEYLMNKTWRNING